MCQSGQRYINFCMWPGVASLSEGRCNKGKQRIDTDASEKTASTYEYLYSIGIGCCLAGPAADQSTANQKKRHETELLEPVYENKAAPTENIRHISNYGSTDLNGAESINFSMVDDEYISFRKNVT